MHKNPNIRIKYYVRAFYEFPLGFFFQTIRNIFYKFFNAIYLYFFIPILRLGNYDLICRYNEERLVYTLCSC